MSPNRKRKTWTFEPDADVKSLMAKALNAEVGRRGRKRGLRSRILNDAVRAALAHLAGKREGAAA